jgi:hypothetical protein
MVKDYPALLDAGCNIVGAAAGRTPSTTASSPTWCAHAARGDRGALRSLPSPPFSTACRSPIDRDEVPRFQGYKKDGRPQRPGAGDLRGGLAPGRSPPRPGGYPSFALASDPGPDRIDAGGERLHIPQIARLWGPIEAVGAGICTVGEAIEGRMRQLFDTREFPLAVMLDSVGSAAAESLAEYANDLLCQQGLQAGTRVTNRISPGYAGWDTAE